MVNQPKKNICDRIERIFSTKSNFDESGFALVDLVTSDIAYDLCHLNDADRKNLKKLGFEFKWFKPDMTDGMIYRWVIEDNRRKSYVLKLYFNMKLVKEGVFPNAEDQ